MGSRESRIIVSDSGYEESPIEDVAEDASASEGESRSAVAFASYKEESEGDGSEQEVGYIFSNIERQQDCA